ncbi:unnamed protein product [Gordionus sp. m RMFG-2023]
MTESQRSIFEQIVLYCDTFVNLIPLPFVLGFFVSLIMGRWWEQFQSIPLPDESMIMVNSLIQGKDEKTRLIRRTLMRYLNLTSVLIFRSISAPVKRRFPDMESVVEAGFMTYKELKIFENITTPHSKWWLPCVWFSNLVVCAYNEKRLTNDYCLRVLLMQLADFRRKCAALYAYDWISVPLVYTQVVSLANYMYFIANLMGRQILDPTKRYTNRFDIYFPVFTFLQFLFYMGWLKVAEQLMNPFGEDEDDFEINWIIDRNFQISMLAVDELHCTFPDLEKDVYWDDPEPELPYTEASKFYKKNSWMGSTADIYLTRDDVNEIDKDLLSQENLRNLNPFNNFHEAIHRLSSKSFARSRKSNHSIKSEILESPYKIQMDTNLNPFSSQYPSSRSSISNHFYQNGLGPIKEQRFEVTKIKDNEIAPTKNDKMMFNFSNHIQNDQNIVKKPVILDNDRLNVETSIRNNTNTIPENDCITNPGKKLNSDLKNIFNENLILLAGGRKKKISAAGDNNSTFMEYDNDLTVKGNISNLAKFHDKKMREKMLRASAGYVAENFTNSDTPYIKKAVLKGSVSCPPLDVKKVIHQRLTAKSSSKNILRKLSSHLRKSPSPKSLRETNKFSMHNSLIRHSRRSRRKKRSKSKKSDDDYHPFLGSKNYTTNKRVPAIQRASLTSEIKSLVFPPTMTHNKDSQLQSNSPYNDNLDNPDSGIVNNNRARKEGISFSNNTYSSYKFLTTKNLSESISNRHLPTQDPPPYALKASANQRSAFPRHASPKRSIYKRQMSLPYNERLLEEDESYTNNNSSSIETTCDENQLLPYNNAETLIKSGNSDKKIKGIGGIRNIKELFNTSSNAESQLKPEKEMQVDACNMAYLEEIKLESKIPAAFGTNDKKNVQTESVNKDNNAYKIFEIANI